MSVDATRATWKLDKKVTAIQKLILLALADRAGESHECWPSLARMMADTNLDRKTLIENRQKLISLNLIQYTGHFAGSKKQIPVMRLMYVESKQELYEKDKEIEYFTSTENGTGTESGTRTSTENGTGNQYRKRDTEPKRFEPKKEPKISCALSMKGTINCFESFWSLYPSKKAKKKCQEIWKRKKLDSHFELILQKLQTQVTRDKQFLDGFIPNPSTYLNQERWNDEITYPQESSIKKEIQKRNDTKIFTAIKQAVFNSPSAEAVSQLQSLKNLVGIRK